MHFCHPLENLVPCKQLLACDWKLTYDYVINGSDGFDARENSNKTFVVLLAFDVKLIKFFIEMTANWISTMHPWKTIKLKTLESSSCIDRWFLTRVKNAHSEQAARYGNEKILNLSNSLSPLRKSQHCITKAQAKPFLGQDDIASAVWKIASEENSASCLRQLGKILPAWAQTESNVCCLCLDFNNWRQTLFH